MIEIVETTKAITWAEIDWTVSPYRCKKCGYLHIVETDEDLPEICPACGNEK